MRQSIKFIQAVNISSAVNPYVKTKEKPSLSSLAPSWFRDGVNERIIMGDQLESAIAAMKASPFFRTEWVK